MIYVVGVDGGQTTTTAVIMDGEGRLLGYGLGGPANHIHEPGGVARIQNSLHKALSQARDSAKLADAPFVMAYLGMTGGSTEMEALCWPVVDAAGSARMTLGHDSLIALYSVTLGRPGVAVIGGTGSVGFGRDRHGHSARTGGWGYLMGDEGSGYWIALRALNACVRARDGIGPATNLLDFFLRKCDVATLLDLHRLVYSDRGTRPDIAALAECVTEAARSQDRVAARILQDAGGELGHLAAGVLRSLKMHGEPILVGTVGGVFKAGAWVIEPFTEKVREEAPLAIVTSPQIPGAAAAALLALEAAGMAISGPILKNVLATLPELGPIKQ